MKANTQVVMAVRNIGDSSDNGEIYEGPLRDAIFWLATLLGGKTMAKRFAIGIGRDRAGALAAIETKRSSTGLVIELEDELNKLMAGLGDEESDDESIDPATLLDTWKGVQG
jgi:hypothetical protein